MALGHDATITPNKAELLTRWVPTQVWCPRPDADVEVIGAFRFDDPEGQVGLETHLVMADETVLHVPLTYRAVPMKGNEDALVGQMEHSVLGTRYVYDGLRDPRHLLMLAGATMTGQGEALAMIMYDGQWFIAPANVHIVGGGWTQERVSVDGFEPVSSDESGVVFRNGRFEMRVHRRPLPGKPASVMGLTAHWDGGGEAVVLAEVHEL